MPIHRTIVYENNTTNCAECTASPQLTVTLAQTAGATDLYFKHNGQPIKELQLRWTAGATAPFTLDGDYSGTGLHPRVREAAFEYIEGGSMVEPISGGLTWSRASNKLTFVFQPLGCETTEETKGIWCFNPSHLPPIKLKVVITRKTDSYTCP